MKFGVWLLCDYINPIKPNKSTFYEIKYGRMFTKLSFNAQRSGQKWIQESMEELKKSCDLLLMHDIFMLR